MQHGALWNTVAPILAGWKGVLYFRPVLSPFKSIYWKRSCHSEEQIISTTSSLLLSLMMPNHFWANQTALICVSVQLLCVSYTFPLVKCILHICTHSTPIERYIYRSFCWEKWQKLFPPFVCDKCIFYVSANKNVIRSEIRQMDRWNNSSLLQLCKTSKTQLFFRCKDFD